MTHAAKGYVVVHGHFYQPPRENPWTEEIEVQPSAAPFHDWNERILSECYRANAFARIYGGDDRILGIENNYRKMSFNFGPTLLSWMKRVDSDTYRRILEADAESRVRLGRGNALAQAYNHMILPLATEAERRTQIRWGIEDFRHRFGRPPEGMWLPETAANLEVLRDLERAGIRFTILSPYQAERVRPLASGQSWRDVGDGSIDPSRAYRCWLDPGRTRSIAIFFYDGPVSHSISFQGVLRDARIFQERLTHAWSPSRRHAQLVHVANDGETYGHHFRFGDLTLAYTLHRSLEKEGFVLTNYAAYLEAHPPEWEVEIKAGPDGLGTAWSCAHGTLRWHEDCGCTTGSQAGWTQKWRRPLRQALNWLRDRTTDVLQEFGPRYYRDPWEASDRYVHVILRDAHAATDRFLEREGKGLADEDSRVAALRLMEMRRNAMLMFTSCGWFFADLSGIETIQCLQYAARALELAESFPGVRLESAFLDLLDRARSNVPEWGTGRKVWSRGVRPSVVDPMKVAAHFAVADLVHRRPDRVKLFRNAVERRHRIEHGAAANPPARSVTRVVLSRLSVTSELTRERVRLLAACARLGSRKVLCAIGPDDRSEAEYADLERTLVAAIHGLEPTPEGERRLSRRLALEVGKRSFRLEDLLLDQRLGILEFMTRDLVTQLGDAYLDLYDSNREAMEALHRAGMPAPREFSIAAEYALGRRLDELLRIHKVVPGRTMAGRGLPPLAQARRMAEEFSALGVVLTPVGVGERFDTLLRAALDSLAQTWDPRLATELLGFLSTVRACRIPVEMRRAQDRFARVVLRDGTRGAEGARPAVAGGGAMHVRARVRKTVEALAEALGFATEAVARAWGDA